jgi:hypothetical protein
MVMNVMKPSQSAPSKAVNQALSAVVELIQPTECMNCNV